MATHPGLRRRHGPVGRIPGGRTGEPSDDRPAQADRRLVRRRQPAPDRRHPRPLRAGRPSPDRSGPGRPAPAPRPADPDADRARPGVHPVALRTAGRGVRPRALRSAAGRGSVVPQGDARGLARDPRSHGAGDRSRQSTDPALLRGLRRHAHADAVRPPASPMPGRMGRDRLHGLRRRFGVSRTHVRTLFKAAAAAGTSRSTPAPACAPTPNSSRPSTATSPGASRCSTDRTPPWRHGSRLATPPDTVSGRSVPTSYHKPARRMSEAEIRIAKATARQSPSNHSDFA